MTKIIKHTVFFCLCLLCGMTYGQTGTLYRVPFGGVDNIVRYEPVSGKHIAYSLVAGNENHFSLTDLNSLLDVKVADGLKVKDFEILDGLVFFCGENGSGSGFLGWFNISDLFYGGGSAYIDQTLSALGLLTLDNIEVFRNPSTGNIHVVGYGVHMTVASYHTLYRAFEAVGLPTTGMQYRTLDLWCWGVYGDVSDVEVTDNFVVYLSSARNQACPDYVGIGITLQPFPKYDMFGTPPFYYHYFQLTYISSTFSPSVVPINNDPYNNFLNNNVHPQMVYSTGDKVAVCTYRKDLDENSAVPVSSPYGPCLLMQPNASYITHLVFDLSALVPSTNNFILMTSNVVCKLNNLDVSTIDGFIYDPQTHRYIILHRHEKQPSIMEHAITMVDFLSGLAPTYFESSYQTYHNTSSGWLPKSICRDGSLHYTVMGYDMATSEPIIWHNSFVPASGICDNVVQYPTDTLFLVPGKHYENNVKPMNWQSLQFVSTDTWPIVEFPCILECY